MSQSMPAAQNCRKAPKSVSEPQSRRAGRATLRRSRAEKSVFHPVWLGGSLALPILKPRVIRSARPAAAVIVVLAVVGCSEPDPVPELIAQLESSDFNERIAAADALREFGPDAADAVPALSQCLTEVHPGLRQAAARTLGEMGAAADPARRRADGRTRRSRILGARHGGLVAAQAGPRGPTVHPGPHASDALRRGRHDRRGRQAWSASRLGPTDVDPLASQPPPGRAAACRRSPGPDRA